MKTLFDLKDYRDVLETINDKVDIMAILKECSNNLKWYEKYDSVLVMRQLLEKEIDFCDIKIKHLREQIGE